jgi:hypothetical protein
MRFSRKKRSKPNGALSAVAEAVASKEQAQAELARQRAAAHTEHRDVVAPLRRMRDRNHLAEMFIQTIQEGYRR